MSADILHLYAPVIICALASVFFLLFAPLLKNVGIKISSALFFAVAALFIAAYLYFYTDQAEFPFFAGHDTFLFQILILLTVIPILLLSTGEFYSEKNGNEYFALIFCTLTGTLLIISSAEMISFFIALEILSLPLYALCAGNFQHKKSAEAALKYFLLGAFSSAVLLYGFALLFGLCGTTEFAKIASSLTAGNTAYVAMILVCAGVFFKLALVPFQFWVVDTYQGAPTPITSFMATVVKIVAAVISLKILWNIFPAFINIWSPLVWAVAALTVIFANITALIQRDIKRLLAYSSISHAGYIAMAFLALKHDGVAAVIFYLISYCSATLGAFAVVQYVEKYYKRTDVVPYYALIKSHPFLAIMMTIYILSLTGLPPTLTGLMAKFFIFSSVISAGYIWLAVLGIITAILACAYYLPLIGVMFFKSSELDKLPLKVSFIHTLLLIFLAIICIIFGLLPGRLYELGVTLL